VALNADEILLAPATYSDMDGDGLTTWEEWRGGTNPWVWDDREGKSGRVPDDREGSNHGELMRIVHADAAIGNDDLDGYSPRIEGRRGPKRRIRAALGVVADGGVIQLAPGVYPEKTLGGQGKNVILRPMGSVVIRP
jgi:hypothetical protein